MADTVDSTRGRVLSIQSHVVHGHVGNTAAAFPLQLLGYEVNIINSVQFSNHTGYKHFKGQVLNASDLQEIVSGLRDNNLLCNYTHLLTGYVGSPSFLREVQHLAEELKQLSPNLVFVCDPVLGDDGKLYVPSELVDIYRENLLPVADIITPNQFEAELLSGIKIDSEEAALKAIKVLLSKGPKVVVITSLELDYHDKLVLLAASKKGENVRLVMPKLPASFTGTGDLFSASLLAWSDLELKVACEKSVSTMHCILKRTLEQAMKQSGGQTPSVEQLELRLVQSRHDIENPPDIHGLTSNGRCHVMKMS